MMRVWKLAVFATLTFGAHLLIGLWIMKHFREDKFEDWQNPLGFQ